MRRRTLQPLGDEGRKRIEERSAKAMADPRQIIAAGETASRLCLDDRDHAGKGDRQPDELGRGDLFPEEQARRGPAA